MHIEEMKKGDERKSHVGDGVSVSDAKRILVGVGACALFYPTLLYNVVMYKIQEELQLWDKVDELKEYCEFGHRENPGWWILDHDGDRIVVATS